MQLVRSIGFGISCMVALASPARAASPSAGCKTGAESCRAAYVAYNKCLKGKDGSPETCKADKKSTDEACKSTTSVCHTDGSRTPPSTPR